MKYLKLFANCIIVNGYSRSAICDLQRRSFKMIPHSLADLFDKDGAVEIEQLRQSLAPDDRNVLEEYIEFLENEELVFFCTEQEKDRFPPLSMDWDYAGEITNCIIDVNQHSDHNFNRIFEQIDEVNCRNVMVRSFDFMSLDKWQEIMDIINKSAVRAVDIITKDAAELSYCTEMVDWVKKNKKIRCLTIHSSNENRVLNPADYGFGNVFAVSEQISSEKHCGIFHAEYFTASVESFTESQQFNSCLNRKISVDVNGNIKNCPSISQGYGNIRETTFKEVLHIAGFKEKWSIAKDQVTVCRDCEFRHICTDCRAYLENPEDMYSKPLKCGYNPYTCEWERWSTNPVKQMAIEYYGMDSVLNLVH